MTNPSIVQSTYGGNLADLAALHRRFDDLQEQIAALSSVKKSKQERSS